MVGQIVRVSAVLGLVIGGLIGFVLGSEYPPTMAFAAVEGAILFGIPIFAVSALLGVAAVDLQRLGERRRHR